MRQQTTYSRHARHTQLPETTSGHHPQAWRRNSTAHWAIFRQRLHSSERLGWTSEPGWTKKKKCNTETRDTTTLSYISIQWQSLRNFHLCWNWCDLLFFSDHQWSEFSQAQRVCSERRRDRPIHHHRSFRYPCRLRWGTNQDSATQWWVVTVPPHTVFNWDNVFCV